MDRFGPYIIEAELGRGAIGVVYRARHADLARPIALKVLHDIDAATATQIERFHREALAAAKLSHPNIVAIHDAGQVDDTPFIAMELVEGETLRLDRLPLRARVSVLAKIADALHHAHTQGVVHRDLKPANILVDARGEPRLADFGLAHLAGQRTQLTRSGSAIGTPLYMSPEQVRGLAVGPPADVFSLGVLLYEALTGRPPFEGQTMEQVFRRILEEEPAVPRAAPAGLAAVCLKAIEKDPARRYASARAFADELRSWIDGRPTVTRRSTARGLVKLMARRRLPLGIAAGLVFTAALAAFGIARWRAARHDADVAAANLGEAGLFLPMEKELDVLRMKFYQPGFLLTDEMFGRFEALIGQIDAHMHATVESAQGHYLIGRCREVIADDVGAERAYYRALALDPQHVPSLAARGRCMIGHALRRRFLVPRSREEGKRESLAEASEGLTSVSRAAQLAGAGRDMQLDLAEAYVALLQRFGTENHYTAAGMLTRWKDEPGAEEFLLLEAICAPPDRRAAVVEQVLRRCPSDFRALLWRALARREIEEKIAGFTEALRIHPRFSDAYRARSSLRAGTGDVAGALDDLARAIEFSPGRSEAYVERATIRGGRGDLDGAFDDYGRALEIDPRDVLALCSRGLLRRQKGDVEGAIDDYTRALEIDPLYLSAWMNRGAARFFNKDYDGAIEDLTRAIELDPRSAKAFTNRGAARASKRDFDGAIADFDLALEADAAYAQAWLNRGQTLADQGKLEAAIHDWEQCVRVDPKGSDAQHARRYIQRARAALRKKQH